MAGAGGAAAANGHRTPATITVGVVRRKAGWRAPRSYARTREGGQTREAQGTSAASFPNSSGKYARTVVVRTLPRDVRPTDNLVIASPSGISSTRTTSY